MKRGIACLGIPNDKTFLSKQTCPTPHVFIFYINFWRKAGGDGVDCSRKGEQTGDGFTKPLGGLLSSIQIPAQKSRSA